MKKSKIAVVAFLALALGIGASVAFAKSDNAKAQSNNGKSKADKTANLKNFKQPNVALGETNAKVHKEKTTEVIAALEQVAVQEETAGNIEVSDQVEQVAAEQEQVQEPTTEAIEQVESRGSIKKLIVGPDYKNLGQLRSSLVHSSNEIRKLTASLSQTQDPNNQALLEAQIATLSQERARIQAVIDENESGFSLFGWLSRFMAGYNPTPTNGGEEDDLTDEIQDAIDNTPETPANVPSNTPEVPANTPANTPETPANVPSNTPEVPANTPTNTPTNTPVNTPAAPTL